jgi:hypothetical protein
MKNGRNTLPPTLFIDFFDLSRALALVFGLIVLLEVQQRPAITYFCGIRG